MNRMEDTGLPAHGDSEENEWLTIPAISWDIHTVLLFSRASQTEGMVRHTHSRNLDDHRSLILGDDAIDS
jgi:hypothetical protein